MLRDDLISIGDQLFQRGLQTTRSGNISVRDGDSFVITKTGTNLGRLKYSDLVAVDLSKNAPIPESASCETPVHRAIYNATNAGAIVHAHPPYAIALAQTIKGPGIEPIHNEGLAGLTWIPIIDTSVPGSDIGENPTKIASELTSWCSLIVRGHGAFAIGSSLDDALYRMLLLEEVCKIACILESLGKAKDRAADAQAPIVSRNKARIVA